jgi:hypothetical protein
MALMLATELVALRRIVSGCAPITHFCQLGGGEQLKLPHPSIIPHRARNLLTRSAIDHAKFGNVQAE